ncbi:MAG TPA: NADH-quinone oxidoreductase subunit C [Spirochaetia bacterium]|nr:NADH-quinone oxidoreductase subunit C [Spirochaetia bacterium]
MEGTTPLHNGATVPVHEVAMVPVADFRRVVAEAVRAGAEIVSFFAAPAGRAGGVRLMALLSEPRTATIGAVSSLVGDSWQSLTPDCAAAHLFEREIFEQFGIRPQGHPWLKPVRFPPGSGQPSIGDAPFFTVEGEEVHEVAVGPVHAGVIEPGHFRFQCHGEQVLHLEISLGYQHRGAEALLEAGPDARSLSVAETLAGDTTVGHATAYCEILEALGGTVVPPRALALRAIALELERAANHVGDLGALAGDVGFLPTASWCGRVRGDILNATALICGNRLGRGIVKPGGVGYDLDEGMQVSLEQRVAQSARDSAGAIDLLWKTPSVLARFEGTGTLERTTALSIGMTGPAARACGIERDVRQDHPSGLWRFAQIPASTWKTGDVFARAYVRGLEVQRSLAFVREQIASLPEGVVRVPVRPPARGSMAVTLVEGWRGAICHAAITDRQGRLQRYKVVDPSFRNWFGLALAMRDGQISDFPLCNKSFNLSYCGHDL